GSQITNTSPYLDALDKVLDLIEQLKREGIIIHHLDLGGGLGIDYGSDAPPDITMFTNTLLNRIDERGFTQLDVILEPGRSLVGNAAGAYGFVMASNYNTRGRPAEVMVDGDQAHLVRERETTNSLFANERTIGTS
ncbi:MAG: hypothetical protein EBW95_08040, partial [Burkholderiaceae bacterium]|nr:hypothetical protein [Burkholderiaceae bacterium]